MTSLERGVTHPQIHIDYYEWRKNLDSFDKSFIESASVDGLLMFAWSCSREVLRNESQKSAKEGKSK